MTNLVNLSDVCFSTAVAALVGKLTYNNLPAHQGPDSLSPYVFFLHIISLFSAVTAFNKRDTYRCSQRSKVNWFICSLLGHYHMLTATELKRKRVSVHIDITCKMYRSILSPAPMCWTLVLVLLQHFFLHPFSKCRDPCSSVAAAAAGWPSFSTPAEIQSFRSALLRWPMGKGRIPSPTRPILLSLIRCLSCSVTRSWGIVLMTRTGISVVLQEHDRPLALLLHCAFVTYLYSMQCPFLCCSILCVMRVE